MNERYREVCENRDWSVTVCDDGTVELEKYSPAGEDFAGDSRRVLAQAAGALRDRGYWVRMGVQCEFYLFAADEAGRPTLTPHDRAGYLDVAPADRGENVRRALLRAGQGSVAGLFVAQMQDYLGLGGESRINVPGVGSGNWRWRLLPGQITAELAEEIRSMTSFYGRCPWIPEPDGSEMGESNNSKG